MKFKTRMGNHFRKLKRNRIKKRITANPHTLEEVSELLKREYGAVEVSQQSFNYQEQRKCLKASLVMRHRPDLLGGTDGFGAARRGKCGSLKTFWEQVQEREKMAAEIADDIFPLDFHIYEIKCPKNCMMQIGVEIIWQVFDGSCSGDKGTIKQFKKIYLYYGVTAEDIKNEMERYKSLLGVLCS